MTTERSARVGERDQPARYTMSDDYRQREIATRGAAESAGFFLPHLRPGMRLLDVGSGPGSITLDLAALVAPGEVVGVDVQEREVEAARALASERSIDNARFEVGDAYALPFPDASFDAVFSHATLLHLGDPARALREMRRVLRPGGVAGVADPDRRLTLQEPTTPLLELFQRLFIRISEYRGGSPFYAGTLRTLLLEAGFARTEASARPMNGHGAGTLEATRRVAANHITYLRGLIAPTALAEGWIDQAQLDAIEAELRAWGERPDAFSVLVFCQALGWVDGGAMATG
jgi:SAM-dependent methyltransferase